MPNTFFAADTHFRHRRIVELSNRPFLNLADMEQELVLRWNAVVSPKDDVWHLGDFSFGRPEEFVRQLNGHIHLILGNHDSPSKCRKAGFASVRETHRFKGPDGIRIWLSHYPHRAWPGSAKGQYHLHGHSHGHMPRWGRSLDVGVDCWDYRPVPLERLLIDLRRGDDVDHHEGNQPH